MISLIIYFECFCDFQVPTVVRHSKDRDLSDGAVSALHTTSSLVDGGQICVHVTGETTTTGHLFPSSGHLQAKIRTISKICKEHNLS